MLRLTQGIDGFGNMVVAAMQQSDTIYVNVFAGSTAQYVTVPAGANFVLFSASQNVDFYMLLGVTSGLVVPSATATETAGAQSIPELNPVLRQLNGATHIGLVPAAACNITMAFYS
jgi:hypothetical protein